MDGAAREFLASRGFNPDEAIKNEDFSGMCLFGLDFSGAEFLGCDFSNADLSYAVFRDANLYRCKFNKTMLYVTKIERTVLIRADFSGAYLYGAHIHDVDPTLACFDDLSFEDSFRQTELASCSDALKIEVGIEDDLESRLGKPYTCNGTTIGYRPFQKNERWLRMAETYNIVKRLFRSGGYVEIGAKFYLLERVNRRKSRDRDMQRFVDWVFEKICGYGERPVNSFIGLAVVWILCAIMYPLFPMIFPGSSVMNGQTALNYANMTSIKDIMLTLGNSSYFSAVTMTTLGYGDWQPLGYAKILVVAQTYLGMALLAVAVASLAKVIIRD